MRTLTKLPRFAVLSILLLPLIGCSPHSPDERYYLLATNIKLPYWLAAKSGLERAAAEMQVKVQMVGPETYDPQAQAREFRALVKIKPPGILVSPADPALMKPEIDAAIAEGIPVITIDSDSPGSKRLTFIGTNNYQAGLMGGRVAAKRLGGQANVVVYTIPGQANLEERLRGYQDAFEPHPRIKIVDVINIKGDPRIAFDKTVEIVEKRLDQVDAFVCLEASGGKGVAEVLERKEVKGKTVVAMDTDQETLEWVQKGFIVATVAQKPYTMAFLGLKMLDDLHHHKPRPLDVNWAQEPFALLPTFVDTGATLIDNNNVAVFMKARDFATSR